MDAPRDRSTTAYGYVREWTSRGVRCDPLRNTYAQMPNRTVGLTNLQTNTAIAQTNRDLEPSSPTDQRPKHTSSLG
eukprot:1178945-Prorocentrum_minimum.AAC.1